MVFPLLEMKRLGKPQTSPCCEPFQTVDECKCGLACNRLQVNSSGDVADKQSYPDLSGSIRLPSVKEKAGYSFTLHSGSGGGGG